MNPLVFCYTALIGRLILTKAQTTVIAICFGLETPFLVICNGALITALIKTKQYKSIANRFILLLSVSDLVTGAISIPLQTVLFASFSHQRNCWFEMMTMFFGQTNVHFSGYLFMIIAIQRYFNTHPSLRFRESLLVESLLSPTGSVVLVIVALVVSVGHGLVTTYFFDSSQSKIPNYTMMAFNVILGLTVYTIYIRLFWGVKVHVAANYDNKQGSSSTSTARLGNASQQGGVRYYKNFTKTIFLLLISYAVCLIPYVIMDFVTGWYSFARKMAAPQTVRFLYYLSFAPGYSFGGINALMLLYRNREAKRFIKQRFTSTTSVTNY